MKHNLSMKLKNRGLLDSQDVSHQITQLSVFKYLLEHRSGAPPIYYPPIPSKAKPISGIIPFSISRLRNWGFAFRNSPAGNGNRLSSRSHPEVVRNTRNIYDGRGTCLMPFNFYARPRTGGPLNYSHYNRRT